MRHYTCVDSVDENFIIIFTNLVNAKWLQLLVAAIALLLMHSFGQLVNVNSLADSCMSPAVTVTYIGAIVCVTRDCCCCCCCCCCRHTCCYCSSSRCVQWRQGMHTGRHSGICCQWLLLTLLRSAVLS